MFQYEVGSRFRCSLYAFDWVIIRYRLTSAVASNKQIIRIVFLLVLNIRCNSISRFYHNRIACLPRLIVPIINSVENFKMSASVAPCKNRLYQGSISFSSLNSKPPTWSIASDFRFRVLRHSPSAA